MSIKNGSFVISNSPHFFNAIIIGELPKNLSCIFDTSVFVRRKEKSDDGGEKKKDPLKVLIGFFLLKEFF